MAVVRVETETEVPGGWRFTVQVEGGEGAGAAVGGETAGVGGVGGRHEVSLSWVDYEHWSHGMVSPERVVRAVVEAVAGSGALDAIPPRFDAATARRWVADLDRVVRETM